MEYNQGYFVHWVRACIIIIFVDRVSLLNWIFIIFYGINLYRYDFSVFVVFFKFSSYSCNLKYFFFNLCGGSNVIVSLF